MHEQGETKGLLELAVRRAQAAGASRITDVYLAVGELSTVAEESVQWYWETLCPGTLAAGARLHFRRMPAVWLCVDCGQRLTTLSGECCPACGSLRLRIASGQDCCLEAIDIQTGD